MTGSGQRGIAVKLQGSGWRDDAVGAMAWLSPLTFIPMRVYTYFMKTNESNVDRIIRFVIAIAALLGGLATSGILSIVLWVVSVVMLVTSLIGWCPLYRLLGFSTKR